MISAPVAGHLWLLTETSCACFLNREGIGLVGMLAASGVLRLRDSVGDRGLHRGLRAVERQFFWRTAEQSWH